MPAAFGAVNLSVLQNYDSGLPYSAVGTIKVQGAGTGAPTSGTGYDLNVAPGTNQYYFSDRGAFRTDDVWRTDGSINYSFPIWKFQLFAQAEMLNILNGKDAIAVSTSVSAAGSSSNFTAFNPFTTDRASLIECPQGASGATCKAMGANWQKGSAFGTATGPASFQTPRTYRFSLGVRF